MTADSLPVDILLRMVYLRPDAGTVAQFRTEIEQFLEYANTVTQFESEAAGSAGPKPDYECPLRPDKIQAGEQRLDLLQNAPQLERYGYVVPVSRERREIHPEHFKISFPPIDRSEFKPVIGLEIHAQLRTRSKLFCGCPNRFGDRINQNICPVCTGQPGTLPVLNGAAVRMAVLAALSLNCHIHHRSIFVRKSYFYPDLPKGYQITQFEQPLATAGQLRFESDGKPKVVAIGRVHIEEDAGKMIHLDSSAIQPAKSIVDYNRAGVPLIEIVTEPDIDSPKEAADFVRAVRLQLHRLGICEGRMAEGNLRCDANLSIRQPGQQKAGIKTELKNLNSFRAIERSLEFEIQRQTSCLREGRPIRPETRLWDEDAQQTFLLRSKESSPDYRYFPEPDLPPLIISPDMIEKLHRQVPVPPLDKKREYIARYGLPAERAQLLIEHPDYAQFFLAVIERYHNARSVAAWFFNRLLSHTGDLTNLHISPAEFADFLQRIDNADISHGLAAEILARSFQEKRSLPNILADQELQQIHEISPIETWCRSVLREFPRQVMEYRDGKVQLLGFFVGQVMQKSNRRADPNLVKSILLEMLKP